MIEDQHLIHTLSWFSKAFFKMGLCNINCHSLSVRVVNRCGGEKGVTEEELRGSGRRDRKGLAVARGALDEA